MAFLLQYELAMSAKQPFYLDADDLADLADWYGTKKNYDKALEIAEYGLKLHPDSTALMIEYAYLHLDSGKRAKAREIIENLPDTYSPEAKVVRAHLLLSEGKLDDAEQLLDTIEDKEDLANVVDVSYMYLDMGYPDKALAWLNPVKEEYADEEAYIAVVADCYYGKGMIEEAIPLYNQLIDQNPYSAPYWFGLARCHFEDLNFDQAIDACDYALIGDDEFADAYVMKGHCFYQLGNEDAALECYQKAEQMHGLAPEFVYKSRFASRGLFVINILAVGIHPYFLPMTYAVTLALLLEYAVRQRQWLRPALFLGGNMLCTAALGWALGLLYGTATSGGQALYGYFAMNLNALWNPAGVNGVLYSRLLPAQNQVGGNYDAFAYLGLGVLAALPVVVVSARRHILPAVRRHWALCAVCAVLTAFAVSNVITANGVTLDRKSTRLNSSHVALSRMPSSA